MHVGVNHKKNADYLCIDFGMGDTSDDATFDRHAAPIGTLDTTSKVEKTSHVPVNSKKGQTTCVLVSVWAILLMTPLLTVPFLLLVRLILPQKLKRPVFLPRIVG
jgi:hypothetical protein